MPVDAILTILIGCNAGLLGLLIWHLFRCRDTRVEIVALRGLVERMAQEIGTHETGMRGTIHRTANEVMAMRGEISMLKRREGDR